MPFTKHTVQPINISQCPIPTSEQNELECLSNLTLANIIRQLSSLGEHADRIFSELIVGAQNIGSRAKALSVRMERLKDKVSKLDIQTEEVKLNDFTKNHFRSTYKIDEEVVNRQTMPESMRILYEMADPPPELHKLNQYRDDGKDCMKFYTDPQFFFNLWRNEIMKDNENGQKKSEKKKKRPKQPKPDANGVNRIDATQADSYQQMNNQQNNSNLVQTPIKAVPYDMNNINNNNSEYSPLYDQQTQQRYQRNDSITQQYQQQQQQQQPQIQIQQQSNVPRQLFNNQRLPTSVIINNNNNQRSNSLSPTDRPQMPPPPLPQQKQQQMSHIGQNQMVPDQYRLNGSNGGHHPQYIQQPFREDLPPPPSPPSPPYMDNTTQHQHQEINRFNNNNNNRHISSASPPPPPPLADPENFELPLPPPPPIDFVQQDYDANRASATGVNFTHGAPPPPPPPPLPDLFSNNSTSSSTTTTVTTEANKTPKTATKFPPPSAARNNLLKDIVERQYNLKAIKETERKEREAIPLACNSTVASILDSIKIRGQYVNGDDDDDDEDDEDDEWE